MTGTPLRMIQAHDGVQILVLAALLAEALAELEAVGAAAVELSPGDAVLSGQRVVLVGARVAGHRAPRLHASYVAGWLAGARGRWREVDEQLEAWGDEPPASARAAASQLRATVALLESGRRPRRQPRRWHGHALALTPR